MEHELKQWPDSYYPGIRCNKLYQGMVIYKGVLGNVVYWANRLELSRAAMQLRLNRFHNGKFTFADAMKPKDIRQSLRAKPEAKKVKPVYVRRILPSGIYEAGPLL